MLPLAAVVGCRGPGTDVILTTRLRMSAPPGQNAGIIYDMCTNMGRQKERPEDAVKVGFTSDTGDLISERIIRCEKVRQAFR